MGVIQVTSKSTGNTANIDEENFDAGLHELVAGQSIAVRAAEGGEIQAIEATPEAVSSQSTQRVSAEDQAEATRSAVAEEQHGGGAKGLGAFVGGAASAATFGISDILTAPETAIEKEEARELREVQSGARFAGELVGGIAPALLSGGAGALGTAARLTPSGLLAANTARLVSGSKGLAGRALRSGLGSALEGAAGFAGNQLASQTIAENPEFSAESLASAAGVGALFGGGLGALGELGGAALGRLGRRLETPDEKIAREFADVPETLTLRETLDEVSAPRLTDDLFEAPIAQGVETSAIVGKAARETTPQTFGELVTHVDDDAARAFGSATDDLGRIADDLDSVGIPPDIAGEIKSELARASNAYLDAGNRARAAVDDVVAAVGDPSKLTPAKLAQELDDDLEDATIAALAELDEAGKAWTQASESVAGELADTVAAAQRGVDAGPGIRERFSGVLGRIRGGDTLTTAVGVAEGARDVGIDVPLPSIRDVGGPVGEALSIYVRLKAASRLLGRVPATPATRAAAKVATTKDRIRSAIASAGRGAVRAAARPAALRFTKASGLAAAKQMQDVTNRIPQDVEAQAHQEIDAPPQVKAAAVASAVRAHEYLASVAPKNPYAGTPLADTWTPTVQEQMDWRTRRGAVMRPATAISASMKGGFSDMAIEAVREAYPALYASTQDRLRTEASKLQKRLPSSQLQSIGRAYQVPLTISQSPGYGAAVQATFAVPPEPAQGAGAPPLRQANARTSPLGSLQQSPLNSRA